MWVRVAAAIGLVGVVGCGARVDGMSIDGGGGDDGDPADAGPGAPDAEIADAAPLGLWGTPVAIGAAASTGLEEDDATVDATELEIVFAARVTGDPKDLYRLVRLSPTSPWTLAGPIAELNTAQAEHTPRLSADGLTIYFASGRAGGAGSDDIWSATRAAPGQPFGNLTRLATVASAQSDRTYTPCGDDRYVMISFRTGMGDVYEGVVGQQPTLVASLSSAATETGTFPSADCLRIWFASNRDGDIDIFYAHRATLADPWILDGKITELSAPNINESDPWVSPDLRRMVLASDVDGELDVYTSTR